MRNLNSLFTFRLFDRVDDIPIRGRRITETVPASRIADYPETTTEYLVGGEWLTQKKIIEKEQKK